ncbi:MAG: hypothetical protein HY738_18070 [Bacteroidia bacterium]|nr:hypothetical protein [Bacteroidia bacterium]
MNKEERKCPECGEPLVGRIDKKFCCDQCRNNYNNRLNSDNTNLVRNINNILRKNRRILMELNPEGKIKLSKNKLITKGFNFNFHTNIHNTKNGHTYYFCYEQGYLDLKDGFFALVQRKEA